MLEQYEEEFTSNTDSISKRINDLINGKGASDGKEIDLIRQDLNKSEMTLKQIEMTVRGNTSLSAADTTAKKNVYTNHIIIAIA